MAKASNLTLPVLLLLAAVGAAVVFLGPQLVGYVTLPILDKGALTPVIYLYPVSISRSSYVTNPSYAVYNNSANYALLNSTFGFEGAVRAAVPLACPLESDGPFISTASLPPNPNYDWLQMCQLSSSDAPFFSNFSSWFRVSNHFRTSSGSMFTNPRSTAIQLNVSNSHLGAEYSGIYAASLVVMARIKCAFSKSYSWKIFNGSIGESENGVINIPLGTSGCSDGNWRVNRIIVARNVKTPLSGSYPYGALPAIHWIRLVQATS